MPRQPISVDKWSQWPLGVEYIPGFATVVRNLGLLVVKGVVFDA